MSYVIFHACARIEYVGKISPVRARRVRRQDGRAVFVADEDAVASAVCEVPIQICTQISVVHGVPTGARITYHAMTVGSRGSEVARPPTVSGDVKHGVMRVTRPVSMSSVI